jgi:ribosome modulation factor
MSTEKAPRQKLSRKAWDEGVSARASGKKREECPYGQDRSPYMRAWLQGWDSMGPVPNMRVAVPPVRTAEPAPMQKRGAPWFLPEGAPLPTEHVMIRPHPCPECRRVYRDNMSQAVVVRTISGGVAWLACRACGFGEDGRKFTLPVRR